jgi:thiamine-phosphate pyrophosphorylase
VKFDKNMLALYAITDRKCIGDRGLEYSVEQALSGGATMIQLRDKEVDFDTLCKEADSLLKICQKYNAPLIINDNADVVIKTGADGVHLGQNDMELAKAREILGKDKIIGGSARTIELAKKAEQSGADYIGSGAVFGTLTKADAKYIGTQRLKEICTSLSIPVVAIGGVNAGNISQLEGCKISGVAVVSALFGAENVYTSAQELRKLADSVIYGG